jgi:hypothetical protein
MPVMRPLVAWLHRRSRPIRPIRSRPPYVEALEDRLLPTAYVVTTAKDILGDTTPGEVTLRDAITALDGTPSGNAMAVGTATNSVRFAIAGSGPQTIAVGSDPSAANQSLPAISKQVLLDGWSQGGAGYQGPPLIVLNGASAGFIGGGLMLQAGSDGSTVRGLVVQEFFGDGLLVNGASGVLIVGNYLGTDASGTAADGNRGSGLHLAGGATANTVGGTTVAAANLISGNSFANGLDLSDATTSGNVVLGNRIGTDRTGTLALGNNIGVDIGSGATANTIGGVAPGAGNVVSGNRAIGVSFDSGARGNVVLGNRIGTDLTGTVAVGNTGGVFLGGQVTANTIGGTVPGAGNVISGNGFEGIGISDGGTSGNVIQGNLIGTDITGLARLGNASDGVWALSNASPNTIGGTAPGAGNVISGNGANGVDLVGGASGFVLLGNLIGTDKTGLAVLGNAHDGILIGNDHNEIGGTAAGSGNVISGNGANGVEISSINASGNAVQGNVIGTDITGTVALGNADNGVLVNNSANANTIGGTAAGAGNLVSGNGKAGVRVGDDEITTVLGIPTSANVVLGNHIGTDMGGTEPLGNVQAGVRLDTGAAQNTVGGTAAGSGNVIAFNGKGVVVAGSISTGDSVLGNSIIYGNTGPGIDLGDDGPTPNGANPRNFPNHGQNSPTLTALSYARVSGTLSSSSNSSFRLEFFASPPAAGVHEGESLLGSLDVTTDGTGTVSFTAPVVAIPPDFVVTATATNLATGDTSEFSPGLLFQATVYVVTTAKDALGDAAPGELTLRDALTAVDGTPSGNARVAGAAQNIIEFAIPGSGPHTILVGSDPSAASLPLPVIGNSVFLDGWSQGGAGYVGVPLVVLSGGHAGAAADGLQVNAGAGKSVVRGLAIQQFNGNGVELRGASGVQIVGNLIGTVRNGLDGVLLDAGATNNTIGGSGASNVFSNNGLNGIELAGPGTSGNVVLSNFIGTDSSGSSSLGNGADGVRIDTGAAQNTVGGTAIGAGNVIAYNAKGVVVADSASTGDSILGRPRH